MKERRKRLLQSMYLKERGLPENHTTTSEQQHAFQKDYQAKEAHKQVVI